MLNEQISFTSFGNGTKKASVHGISVYLLEEETHDDAVALINQYAGDRALLEAEKKKGWWW